LRNAVIAGAAALVAASGAVVLLWNSVPRAGEPEGSVARTRLVDEARSSARPGDVIFKDGGGVWGRLAASFSANGDGYGHVGVVTLDAAGGLSVIHAGGDPVSGDGRVQSSGLEHFLGASKAAALYRPRVEGEEAEFALAYLAAAVDRAAPFDSAFSLDTEEALYCTELVWRAFSAAAGEDIVPDKSRRSGKAYVAIDDLQESAWLEPVWSFSVKNAGASASD
jgi:hypothetical protein